MYLSNRPTFTVQNGLDKELHCRHTVLQLRFRIMRKAQESEEGLKQNEVHPLLVYVDDDSLLGANVRRPTAGLSQPGGWSECVKYLHICLLTTYEKFFCDIF
jgi:hypothetical protein